MAATLPVDDVHDLVASVEDPELPPVTIGDLGILRAVEIDGQTIVVTITPTYSGCPAVEAIESDIRTVLHGAGLDNVDIRRTNNPPWTTDWITPIGRQKLRDSGIAPPRGDVGTVPVALGRRLDLPVPCPRCGSETTSKTATFGSTACKALYRCDSCLEPFDHIKEI